VTTLEPLKILDVGGGVDGRCKKEFYPTFDVTTLDLLNGYDVMEKGLPDGEWDIIFANHFIEHVSNPDFFLSECKRVMKSYSMLNIGTPNLSAWFNRILFLFGYVPHSVELSKFYNVGKPFNWNSEPLGGHVYVYTVPALIQLLKHHGFRIMRVTGEASTFPCNPLIKVTDQLLTKISPSFASAFRILACK